MLEVEEGQQQGHMQTKSAIKVGSNISQDNAPPPSVHLTHYRTSPFAPLFSFSHRQLIHIR